MHDPDDARVASVEDRAAAADDVLGDRADDEP
jgi:hypothetical protein